MKKIRTPQIILNSLAFLSPQSENRSLKIRMTIKTEEAECDANFI